MRKGKIKWVDLPEEKQHPKGCLRKLREYMSCWVWTYVRFCKMEKISVGFMWHFFLTFGDLHSIQTWFEPKLVSTKGIGSRLPGVHNWALSFPIKRKVISLGSCLEGTEFLQTLLCLGDDNSIATHFGVLFLDSSSVMRELCSFLVMILANDSWTSFHIFFNDSVCVCAHVCICACVQVSAQTGTCGYQRLTLSVFLRCKPYFLRQNLSLRPSSHGFH